MLCATTVVIWDTKNACKNSKHLKSSSGKHQRRKAVHYVEDEDLQDLSDDHDNYIARLELNTLTSKYILWIQLKIIGITMKMELETGSTISVMSEEEFKRKFRDQKFKTADIILRMLSGEHILPVSFMDVQVGGTKQTLPLYIVEKGVSALRPTNGSEITDNYKDVFVDEVVTVKGIKGFTAKLTLRDTCNKPKYVKARTVSFSLRSRVKELNRPEAEGTLTKVQHRDLATPFVPALKKNGSIRICGDFRVTLNPILNIDQ